MASTQQASLEKQLEEMREQLRKKDEETRAKDNEIARLRKLPSDKIGFVDEGSIKYEVEAVEKDSYSPYKAIGGLPFRIFCQTTTQSGVKHLGAFLYCNDNAVRKTWSAEISYSLSLKSYIPQVTHPWIRSYCKIFHPNNTSWGTPKFILWADAMNPSKGYIRNGRFTIEAQIKVIWYCKNAIADFSSSDPQLSDVTLIVGGKAFHVGKNFLAHFSEYFKALFFSGFAEKNKNTIELPDVDAKEFEELLRIIHPQKEESTVTKDNVECLLRLANFFDVPFVLWKCTTHLKESSDLSINAKFELTEQFRLHEVQHHLLEGMKTAADFEKVINSADFGGLSANMQKMLLEKHFKLTSK